MTQQRICSGHNTLETRSHVLEKKNKKKRANRENVRSKVNKKIWQIQLLLRST